MSTRGRKPDLKVIAGGWDELPAAPGHFDEGMAAEWHAIVDDLNGRKLLTPTMLGSVEMYVMALVNVRKAQKSIDDHGVLVVGAEGAMKPNPASGLLWRSQAIVARLASELGLTPAARSKTIHQPKEEEDDLFSVLDL